MRTIIELPETQLDALDAWCRREGISRAEAIRRAIASHLHEARTGGDRPAFGLWRTRPVDGLAYERRLRDEWSAPRTARPGARRRARP
jgi:hypothetical protein